MISENIHHYLLTHLTQPKAFATEFTEKTLRKNSENSERSVAKCVRSLINSPYAERPEGSYNSGSFLAQAFGTVRNISY
jgi:hypothetical protein